MFHPRDRYVISEGAGLAIAGIASAVGGVTATGVNAGRGKRSQRRAFNYNKQLMDYQNDINIRNWQMQNEYNSPSAQMQRYQDAGLNPNLIYGDMNNSDPIQGVSQANAPDDESQVGNAIAQSANEVASIIAQKQMQDNQLKYQRDALDAQLLQDSWKTMSQIAASYKSDELKMRTQKEIQRMILVSQEQAQVKDLEFKQQQLNETIRMNSATIHDMQERLKRDKDMDTYTKMRTNAEIQNMMQDLDNMRDQSTMNSIQIAMLKRQDELDKLKHSIDISKFKADRQMYSAWEHFMHDEYDQLTQDDWKMIFRQMPDRFLDTFGIKDIVKGFISKPK